MKNKNYFVFFIFLILACAIFIVSCAVVAQQLIDEEMGRSNVYGYFSWPTIYITDTASTYTNPISPASGNPITNATVIVSNETTGVSTFAAYNATTHYYTVSENLPHVVGQKVSLSIKTTNETITGAATSTSNPTYSNLFPGNNSSITLPFNISWEVTQGTAEAANTWVIVYGPTTSEAQNYQEVVPISQKSLQITSSKIKTAGKNFSITVFGVNSMTLTNAKSGSKVYVGGGSNYLSATGITIEAQ